MREIHEILLIAVIAGVTALLRFAPFLVFGRNKKTPPFITYLSGVLSYAIMGMLVVYCLKNVKILEAPYGIPELLAGGSVILLHLWKRSTLLSIAAGTLLYMFLIQVVF